MGSMVNCKNFCGFLYLILNMGKNTIYIYQKGVMAVRLGGLKTDYFLSAEVERFKKRDFNFGKNKTQ